MGGGAFENGRLCFLRSVQLGAAYCIPTVAVPALLVSHAMIFAMLLRRRS